MKPLALFILLFVTLAGCAPTVQVVTLRGSNVQPANEGLVLDNDTLTLRYNFASERGQMHISIVNKLNQPLYIDWKRSSFIVGQTKINYWHDVADVQLAGALYNSRFSHYSIGNLSGTISKDDQIEFVPPQTKTDKLQFVLVPTGSLPLAGTFKIEQEKAKWIEKKKPVDITTYAYSVDHSPLTFRNYLTLSTDKDFKIEFHIDTKFWASDVRVMPKLQAVGYDELKQSDGTFIYMQSSFKKADSFFVPVTEQ